jgi:hypothetical protein
VGPRRYFDRIAPEGRWGSSPFPSRPRARGKRRGRSFRSLPGSGRGEVAPSPAGSGKRTGSATK